MQIMERCKELCVVLGDNAAVALLEELKNAPYGKDRKANRVSDALSRAKRGMKVKEVATLPQNDWYFRRARDMDDTIEECLDSLISGRYDEWLQEEEEAKKAPKWPDPPMGEITDDVNANREVVRQYEAQLDAWEGERTLKELAVLNFNKYAIVSEFKRDIDVLEDRLLDEKKAKVQRETFALYEKGEIDYTDAYNRVGYHATLAQTKRVWREGVARTGSPGDAGLTWSDVSDESLVSMIGHCQGDSEFRRSLMAILSTRIGQDRCYFSGKFVVARGKFYYLEDNFSDTKPPEKGLYSLEENEDGWVHLVDKTLWSTAVWIHGEVYAALKRLRNAPEGTMNIRRVISAYGRHETKNFPRLFVTAWRAPLMVGIDTELGHVFDDLAKIHTLAPELVPDRAWWIPAGVRITAKGGLHISRSKRCKGMLLQIHSGESSRGKWGWSGETCLPHDNNKAVECHTSGSSRGGGQYRAAIFALVTEHTPLLLSNGVGYKLERGTLYRVPGLAEGDPGEKQEVGA